MTKRSQKTASSQAAWALLTEGVSRARVQTHQIRHLFNRAQKLVEASEHKEKIFQQAGDLLVGLPGKLSQLELSLDRTGLALAKMGQDFLESRLPLSDRVMVDEAIESAFEGGWKERSSMVARVVDRVLSEEE